MLVGRAAGLLTRTPSVVWFNNALPEPRWQRGLQRRLATATTGAIAVSRATADWAARSYALPRASIDVQYSTPELSAFLAVDESHGRSVREAFGIPDQARVIVLAGRVVDAQKGHFGMVRAMPEILSRVPSAHLLIVGEGRDLPHVGNLVGELELRAQVTLAGMRRDMPNVLAAADVAVVPSLVEEAFPYAAIEASAVGLPVVAFRSGGLPEAVRDNVTGLIVATNDWTALGTALCRCLSEPVLARALGAAGRDFAGSFSKAAEARRFTEYHETIARRAGLEIKADGSP